ncbi:FGGY family carbohydrate kinase [Candidatus Epulonipiscium viviparus]|uniref:FGGY family carbohydrate kinase n=1 Tax=Candidatus Epulonipiscium viviparus TaxID=420336 RepID=UPI00016C01DF|nr:glycerol kinase [Candidatus Epulopiscium viviparus]
MKKYILVIDEGTTGTRALIFDKRFAIVSQSYMEFTQYTPAEDKVEHDAMEIYEKTIQVCRQAMESASIPAEEIESIGITTQRATCVVWNKITGQPFYNAIVWQDVRTTEECQKINETEWGEKARTHTGWTLAPVYTSMMMKWYIENVPAISEAIARGDALMGTIDTWLIWNLTGRQTHAISYSNASVTGSYDLINDEWYTEFLDYLGVPVSIYPTVVNDSGDYGCTYPNLFGIPIPINGAIADQHAALFAQGCRNAGSAKITNGTGSFLDINIGSKLIFSNEGLNTLIAWKIGDKITYALEGYESVTGSAVQWLRDGIEVIEDAAQSETMANSVENSNGVIFVPALSGLSAPFHDSSARGTLFGITRGTTTAHIVRATLEGIVYRMKDILNAIELESKVKLNQIRIDGGLSKNNFVAQRMADMLDVEVLRPASVEATALGAAQMAGLYTGFWTEADLQNAMAVDKIFVPDMSSADREDRYKIWTDRVRRCLNMIQRNEG